MQSGPQHLVRSILAHLSEGVALVDARGALIHSSPPAEPFFGVGGTTHGVFFPDEQTPFPADQLPVWGALKGEEIRGVELFVRDERVPQGRHVRCDGLPLRDERGAIMGGLLLVKDTGKAARSEEEKRRKLNEEVERRIVERTAQLEASNRELEAFAYSVAHDLRAPLRAITSFSDALREDCADRLDEMGLDYLKRIHGGAQRMSALIDGILALSKVNRTTLVASQCDLSALARAVSEQLRAQHPDRQARFTLQAGLVDQGDPQLLRSLVENLLGNAWKFTRKRPLAEIEFGATQTQGVRTYFVKDNGAGFEMEYKHKLFGVFQRLHAQSEFEGSGVGLATAHRIIRRHGGRIWGEGQPDQGACFFFTLNELPPSVVSTAPLEPRPGGEG
ncbi:ATP-binding protein [Hyalangium gracile]|uniref:ATP-binding protein n=1 Tax=Hyalangium gracile TaxID=394092 RepID=UPI001CCB7FE0|nr:ATP-binding protein [Hyalangium gracile]